MPAANDRLLMMRVARFLVVSWALTCAPAFAQAPELSSYKLGSGDMISIRVLGEDDLRREKVRLSDAGTLSFPVLGEIRVKGMTVGALEDYITKGLKGRYLLNPQVTGDIETALEHSRAHGVGGDPGIPDRLEHAAHFPRNVDAPDRAGQEQGRLDRRGVQPGDDPTRVLPDPGRDPQERGPRAQGRAQVEARLAPRFRSAARTAQLVQPDRRLRRFAHRHRGTGGERRDRQSQAGPPSWARPQ